MGSAYYVPGTILGIKDVPWNETNENIPAHCGSYILRRRGGMKHQ